MLLLIVLAPRAGELLPIDAAADARKDFAAGVYLLLGGEGLEPGRLDLGRGLTIEIATDACGVGPDPEAYMTEYNRTMKGRFREVHGIDVDDYLLKAVP